MLIFLTPCTYLCLKETGVAKKSTKTMKANPSLVPLHLQFQVALTEGAVLLISVHSQRESSMWLSMCVHRTLPPRSILTQERVLKVCSPTEK